MCMTIEHKSDGEREKTVTRFGAAEWVGLIAGVLVIVSTIGAGTVYIGGQLVKIGQKLQVVDDHERRISRNEAWIDAQRD